MIVYTVIHTTPTGGTQSDQFESLEQLTIWLGVLKILDLTYQVEYHHINAPKQTEFVFH
jgi:hypothetical protein